MSRFADIDLMEILDHEGLDYNETSGSSGAQLNLKECPNCFVCDTTYNVWTFVAAHLGTGDKKIIGKFFASIAPKTFRPKPKPKIAVHTEIEDAQLPLSFALPYNDGTNHAYLDNRGITAKYAERFKLRYCQYGYHSYEKEGRKLTQNFDGRIIIPVLDLDGELVSFQGRDIEGTSDRKYLFPAQLPSTGRYIYNGHEAMALKAQNVIMCEGAFDVIPVAIACDLFPEMNSVIPVGSFGKHLSNSAPGKESQVDALMKLKRKGNLKTVTIMWDGEYNALNAALDAAAVITGLGIRARIALLPAGKDPNEVDASEIRKAWLDAKTYTKMLDLRWRVQNPYIKT